MDKQDVEYRMYSLKSICEIFDELLSYDTGDDFGNDVSVKPPFMTSKPKCVMER